MDKLRISTVNYLNSTPFVYGLQHPSFASMFDISMDYPAESARKLIANEVDISLIPVGALAELPKYHIVSEYCIGSLGKVNTVKIFSDVPIEEVKNLFLDYQSRTSVLLAKLILDNYKGLTINYLKGYPGYQKEIVENTAGLVIGDRAIRLLGKYKYEYDLSEAWYNWHQLPFVFAVWVSAKPLNENQISLLNKAFEIGMKNRESLILKYAHLNSPFFSVRYYLEEDISYSLDADKMESLNKFLSLTKGM